MSKAEERIRAHLDSGKLCVLDFLEHQLIAGYDSKGFVFLRPWERCEGDSTLPALSFGTWAEALDREGWVGFTFLEKEEERADEAALLCSALGSALRMRSAPEDFEMPGYHVGDAAWAAWIKGVDKGLGSTHGNRWNGEVWAECRAKAADFFAEIGPDMKSARAVALCGDLSSIYRDCSGHISAAAKREAPAAEQKAALAAGRELDRRGGELMKDLLVAALEAP
jgi:hypothetical protein